MSLEKPHEVTIEAAIRFSLGTTNYAASVIKYVTPLIPHLSDSTLSFIYNEIVWQIGSPHVSPWTDSYRKMWSEFLEKIKEQREWRKWLHENSKDRN